MVIAAIAGGIVVLALLAVALLGAWIGMYHHQRAMPNVYLAGVNVAGMTSLDITDVLEQQLPAPPCDRIEVTVGNEPYQLTAAEVGRGWRTDVAIADAMRAGRGSAGSSSFIENLTSLFSEHRLGVEMVAYQAEALATASERVAAEHASEPTDAAARKTATDFTVTDAVDGRRVDPREIRVVIATQLDSALQSCTATVPDEDVAADITTDEAAAAADAAIAMSAEVVIADGEETWTIAAPAMHQVVNLRHGSGAVGVAVDTEALRPLVAGLAGQVEREAAEATFELSPRGVSGVVAGRSGRSLDLEGTLDAVIAQLESRRTGMEAAPVELVAERTEPLISTALANATFAQLTPIGSWTTEFVPNDGNGFGANIHIGADDLDGFVLAPGAQLDFWDAIGPVTEERGYTYGGVIIDGRSVAGGAIGGGICSTSTTLFNAALRAGLQIDSRAAHAYFIDRYPTGLDATVWATESAEQSMIFTNDTGHPIIVRGYTDDADSVTFELWGVADGRSVALSEPVVSDRQSAGDVYEDTTELAPGVTQRVEFPHDGFRSVVTRTVTAGDGSALHSDTFNSHYKTVDGVVLRGVAG